MNGCRILVATVLALGLAAQAALGVTVVSNGAMAQINTAGLPDTTIRELSTLWEVGNPSNGVMFYAQSHANPLSIFRATTTDGGLSWTAGTDTNLNNPGLASPDERNPVVRDFAHNGSLVGFFGTKQGVYGGGYGPNDVLFRATSSNLGQAWSGETLVTFNAGAFPTHTGLNGFIEVFQTSGGVLRGYTAMNNITGTPSSATHLVESTDNGLTWTDLGNIGIPGSAGTYNIVGANSPVFTFTDSSDGLTKMGWFVFGEGTSANRGVNFLISTDEGLTWASGGFSFSDGTIRSGDASFISDTTVRLFYYRNTGSVPSDRQLWYEDFTLGGMSNIQPNNLYGDGGTQAIPEPLTMAGLALGIGSLATYLRRRRQA